MVWNREEMKRRDWLNDRAYWILGACLLVLIGFNLFYRLGAMPIEDWDEARHGVSAYEMLRKGSYMINTYNYHDDYWNLKPPLSFWSVAFGYKVAGFNPLGLRLFSAFAALITIAITALFTRYRYGNTASLLSAAVLATSSQFILSHSARAGDADALFVLWFTAAILSLMMTELHIRWLYVSGLMFSLAFLTKSWHAGTILAIILLYMLLTHRVRRLNPGNVLGFIATSVVPVLVWLVLRFPHDKFTFIKEMIRYDLLARASSTLEGHTNGPVYYLHILRVFHTKWSLTLFMIVLYYFAVMLRRRTVRHLPLDSFTLGTVLWIAVPFTMFTAASTKLMWYILPIYPPLAIVTAFLFTGMLHAMSRRSFRIALASAFAAVFILTQTYIVRTLTGGFTSDHGAEQALLRQIQEQGDYSAYTLFYYEHPDTRNVPQSVMLASKLYVDLKVSDTGALEDFQKESRGLLMLPRTASNERLIAGEELSVVESNS
ncbi:glycosyltransferase family 39 protein [Paenibacillus sp. HN-1]|uniref:ArnT family glycosyltransferase n=1 Tax=Paenibacillus TaxID=44249 RepID=UPI001CA8916F|nr:MULTISPECIES: glycosyltransferase family 39 protein [Paenibacillus]MBY9080434.1 glycosyltransferase family 39 protein [Paenibacillus sp. CGMCC 1.18879]MBY9084014.1 glycosyltransferase family 39 protein [Paenibacillus sinensis]